MRIKKIISQHRRDYSAIMQCEFCGSEEKDKYGYDDRNYHDNVIPNMVCKKCGKTTNSEGGVVEKTPTKYPEGYQI